MSTTKVESEPEKPPRTYRSLTYHVIMAMVHTLAVWPFRTRIKGREYLPKTGGALIVSNHTSFLDIPFVSKGGSPRHVCFVARESLAKSPLLGFIMRSCGAVLIDPKSGDRKALLRVVEHLRAGDLVAMFAEGTRSRDGKLLPFKRGALLAARQARVPVIPCALIGTHKVFGREMKYPRPGRVELRFGPLLDAKADDALDQVRAWIEAQLEGTDQATPSAPETEASLPDPAQ